MRVMVAPQTDTGLPLDYASPNRAAARPNSRTANRVLTVVLYLIPIFCTAWSQILISHFQQVEGQYTLWGTPRISHYEWLCAELPALLGIGLLLIMWIVILVRLLSARRFVGAVLSVIHLVLATVILVVGILSDSSVLYP